MEKCEFADRIGALFDAELSAGEQAALARHVGACEACAVELRALRAVSNFLGTYDPPALSPGRLAQMRQALTDATGSRTINRVALQLLSLAACLAVVGAVWNAAITPTVQAPAAWEGAAAMLNDETTINGNRELALAEWMVTELSPGKIEHD